MFQRCEREHNTSIVFNYILIGLRFSVGIDVAPTAAELSGPAAPPRATSVSALPLESNSARGTSRRDYPRVVVRQASVAASLAALPPDITRYPQLTPAGIERDTGRGDGLSRRRHKRCRYYG